MKVPGTGPRCSVPGPHHFWVSYLSGQGRRPTSVCLSVGDSQGKLSGAGPSIVGQRHEEMEERVFSVTLFV